MLELQVVMGENFNDETQEFVPSVVTIKMEHSLLSLSKWESEFGKPFLSNDDKTPEETIWYIKAMIVSSGVPPEVFQKLTENHVPEIDKYINGKHTATTFRDVPGGPINREIITAEVITRWMVTCKIPLEWGERQHLNKLFAVIRAVNLRNQPVKKMSRRDMLAERKALVEKRRAEWGTRG
jgi:hypothetical protein